MLNQNAGAKTDSIRNDFARAVNDSVFAPYLRLWELAPDGIPIETQSSWLLPVNRDRSTAMLKVMKPSSDERNAAALLRYFDGDGAVRLYEAQADALLLERVDGRRSLAVMATTGADAEAAKILADGVRKLHAPRRPPRPDGLTPLRQRFSSLYERENVLPILARCASLARKLITTESNVVPLHGDLHHYNVLDGGARGWLAIDPKALLGERAYEVANLLGNPWPHADIVHQPERMRRLAALYAAELRLDAERILAFALAHAGLAASWDMEDGLDPTFPLRSAEVLEAAIKG
jgi:streptomycin 6-kinase